MQCPICNGVAEEIGRRDVDGRAFRCGGACKDFEVTGSRLLKFLAADRPGRLSALERARQLARPGDRPVIDSRCL
jgi:hypothetical protein